MQTPRTTPSAGSLAARPWPLTVSAALVLVGGLLTLACLFVPWQIEHPSPDILAAGYTALQKSALRDCFLGWGVLVIAGLAVIEGATLLLLGRRTFPGMVIVPFAVVGLLITLLIAAFFVLTYVDTYSGYRPTFTPAPALTLLGLLMVCVGRIWWGIAMLPPAQPSSLAPPAPSSSAPQR
jgi:hypothetical protein